MDSNFSVTAEKLIVGERSWWMHEIKQMPLEDLSILFQVVYNQGMIDANSEAIERTKKMKERLSEIIHKAQEN